MSGYLSVWESERIFENLHKKGRSGRTGTGLKPAEQTHALLILRQSPLKLRPRCAWPIALKGWPTRSDAGRSGNPSVCRHGPETGLQGEDREVRGRSERAVLFLLDFLDGERPAASSVVVSILYSEQIYIEKAHQH